MVMEDGMTPERNGGDDWMVGWTIFMGLEVE